GLARRAGSAARQSEDDRYLDFHRRRKRSGDAAAMRPEHQDLVRSMLGLALETDRGPLGGDDFEERRVHGLIADVRQLERHARRAVVTKRASSRKASLDHGTDLGLDALEGERKNVLRSTR